ncbi:MAG TPA: hypothetical protein G4O11_10870 [Anaerolineae bacterium]|nr:hypothetical protein [Anaerolineae bacterium]
MSTGHRRNVVGGVGLGKVNPKPQSWQGVSPGDADLAVVVEQAAVEADERIGTNKG